MSSTSTPTPSIQRTVSLGAPSGTNAWTGRGRLTRAAAAAAAPLFFGAGLVQAAARDGFDVRHHTLSLLMNGHYGWIQVLNFMVAGSLFVAAALGMRAAYRPRLRGTGALVAVFGSSLVAAGLFRPDAAFGFPPGTPAGAPTAMTWHGGLHLAVATVGFVSLIVACFTAARDFTRNGERSWARASRLVGGAFFVGFAALGANTALTNVVFVVTAAAAFGWASAISAVRPAAPAASPH